MEKSSQNNVVGGLGSEITLFSFCQSHTNLDLIVTTRIGSRLAQRSLSPQWMLGPLVLFRQKVRQLFLWSLYLVREIWREQ